MVFNIAVLVTILDVTVWVVVGDETTRAVVESGTVVVVAVVVVKAVVVVCLEALVRVDVLVALAVEVESLSAVMSKVEA